jgi:citrate synthase
MMKSFRYDAHPMGILVSTIAAMSTLHPEANPALSGNNIYKDPKFMNKQIYRLLGNMPTLAANSYRHRIGREFNEPNAKYGYVENFLYMLDKYGPLKYKPHPVIVKALDILFILHAEHELNCSTAAVRHLASSGVDVYTVISGAASALYGPFHGGANEAVLRMLEEIGTKDNIPQFIADVKSKKRKLMGFGHRVYKNYDPRARIIKDVAEEVFAIVGKEPLIELAVELEKIALSDPYFIEKKLYPNVDFYTGVIYKALGFPTDMFPVLFCIPRAAGWLAHWVELLDDPATHIYRPRQVYLGYDRRPYIESEQRKEFETRPVDSYVSPMSRRRDANKPNKLSPSQNSNKMY